MSTNPNEILESLSEISNEFDDARIKLEGQFCTKAAEWAKKIIEELNSRGQNLELKQTGWDEDDGFKFLVLENGVRRHFMTQWKLALELSESRKNS
jgi:hypothetical protein